MYSKDRGPIVAEYQFSAYIPGSAKDDIDFIQSTILELDRKVSKGYVVSEALALYKQNIEAAIKRGDNIDELTNLRTAINNSKSD